MGVFDWSDINLLVYVMIGAGVAILPILLGVLIMELQKRNKNRRCPKLLVDATVHCKWAHGSKHYRRTFYTHTTYSYHVAFELESGKLMDFRLPFAEYDVLEKGERGILSFQGTQYLGFERK